MLHLCHVFIHQKQDLISSGFLSDDLNEKDEWETWVCVWVYGCVRVCVCVWLREGSPPSPAPSSFPSPSLTDSSHILQSSSSSINTSGMGFTGCCFSSVLDPVFFLFPRSYFNAGAYKAFYCCADFLASLIYPNRFRRTRRSGIFSCRLSYLI